MISYSQLQKYYELTGGKTLISKPTLEVIRTVRKVEPLDERARYQEVIVKTVKGVEIRLTDAHHLIEDFAQIMNGVLSYHRAQSELAVNIEGVCLIPSKGFKQDDTLFLDQIVVMEYFGRDLTKTLKKDVKWPEHNVDKLVRFFIRALRMMRQRGIIHGDIKPHNIVCNEEFDFKLIDFDNSEFHRSSTTVTTVSYTHLTLPTIYSV
eukprot:TRINITY_DN3851_c0_g1_i6.p1 TRINITY_DN3851_c0_g1~~TRINITY_DN3851_c0_g1_i6.p1  ORF type:complete len:207 (-),score=37.06 TRINITY_DN3851_c0_g1_i6:40-660(-)